MCMEIADGVARGRYGKLVEDLDTYRRKGGVAGDGEGRGYPG